MMKCSGQMTLHKFSIRDFKQLIFYLKFITYFNMQQ